MKLWLMNKRTYRHRYKVASLLKKVFDFIFMAVKNFNVWVILVNTWKSKGWIICKSICIFVYISIYLFILLSMYLFVYPSVYLFIHLFIYLSTCLSIYLSSIYLSICLCIKPITDEIHQRSYFVLCLRPKMCVLPENTPKPPQDH